MNTTTELLDWIGNVLEESREWDESHDKIFPKSMTSDFLEKHFLLLKVDPKKCPLIALSFLTDEKSKEWKKRKFRFPFLRKKNQKDTLKCLMKKVKISKNKVKNAF